jgi:hypothetical protein
MKVSRTIPLVILTLALSPAQLFGQIVDVQTAPAGQQSAVGEDGLTMFGRGFVDTYFSGQIETTAEFLKVRIGEPEGFSLPLYLLVGSMESGMGSTEQNGGTAISLISPTGGLLNISMFLNLSMYHSTTNITQFRLSAMGAGKLVNGQEVGTTEGKMFPAGYYEAGIYFQTGAWEAGGVYSEGGIFWIQAKYAGSVSSLSDLETVFGPSVAENPHGFRSELGMLIKDKVNIRLGIFLAQGGDQLPSLDEPVFKLALDYKVSK